MGLNGEYCYHCGIIVKQEALWLNTVWWGLMGYRYYWYHTTSYHPTKIHKSRPAVHPKNEVFQPPTHESSDPLISTFDWGDGNSHDILIFRKIHHVKSHDILRSRCIHLTCPLRDTACFPEPMWGRAKAWMGPQFSIQGLKESDFFKNKLGISWYYGSLGFNGNNQLDLISLYLIKPCDDN